MTTHTTHRLMLAAGVTVAAVILTGCGSDSANKAVEQAIQSANPTVSADVQDGGAGITATDKSGGEISVGTAAKVPADFPSSVPLPDESLQGAAKGSSTTFVFTYKTTGTGTDAAKAYASKLAAAGFTIESTGGAANLGGVLAKGKGYNVQAISVGGSVLTVAVKPL